METTSKAVINHYLSDDVYEAVRKDFVFLIDKIIKSGFEYDLQIRDKSLNLYYKGNSLGEISYRTGQKDYKVSINCKFVDDSIINRFSPNGKDCIVNNYCVFSLTGKKMHSLYSEKNLSSMGRMVKEVHFQEEIVFEHMLLTDNANRDDLIIIDRQVMDSENRTRMDLLALTQKTAGKYQFCVLEVKLGNNSDLKEKVSQQLEGYVEGIKKNFPQYKECYEKNFKQKQGLGLFPSNLKVEIVEGVLGMVVVGGYSGLAEESIAELKEKHPAIKVLHIKNEIKINNLI